MRLRISLQAEAVPYLREMAQEAGVGLDDIVEIAVYNLIGVYANEHPEKFGGPVLPPDSHGGAAGR